MMGEDQVKTKRTPHSIHTTQCTTVNVTCVNSYTVLQTDNQEHVCEHWQAQKCFSGAYFSKDVDD